MSKLFIVMGVSASGKSTLGQLLADKLEGEFFDGDDYHPEANKKKMSEGKALDDNDRQGWLEVLADLLAEQAKKATPTFVACSALKAKYRDVLSAQLPSDEELNILWLDGDKELIRNRIKERYEAGVHFMPPELLDSQLEVLETPAGAIRLDISNSPEELAKQVISKIKA